jgi:hypothetical protein
MTILKPQARLRLDSTIYLTYTVPTNHLAFERMRMACGM